MGFLIAAITLGFLGSFHCVGMCGPIALALPVYQHPPLTRQLLILLYNSGRIITYTVFGLLAGVVGKSFAMAGLQQGLSVAIGIILLASVFLPFKGSLPGYVFFMWIRSGLGRLFAKGTRTSLWLIGLLNGFLPCGLVYVAIAGATANGSVLKGALFMAAFGLGTVPMMYALPFIGSRIPLPVKNNMRKATPVIITIMAVLLILRGLNLGIPYISPKINAPANGLPACHQQGTCCHK